MISQVVPLRLEHLPQIVLICNAGRSAHFNWDKKLIEKELENAQGLGLFMPGQQELCSFLFYRNIQSVVEITSLATKRELQKKGYMLHLLEHFIATLCASQEEVQEIWIEVSEKNVKALKLYEKLEFQQTGIRQNYYQDGSAAILLTHKY